MLFASCLADTQILDYSNAQSVQIKTGTARIQTGTFRIIHVINIALYQKLIEEIEMNINQYINRTHILYPYLLNEITQTKDVLYRLKIKNRTRRSLNFIGSAWKWIAGNPDHDDFEILKEKTNGLLENNNNQTIINKLTTEKINEIRDVTNKILKMIKTSSEVGNDLMLSYKYKLEILKEEVKNVEYAINWAKKEIVNAYVLSEEETKITEEIFDKDNIPYINLDEALEFSKIKIAVSNNTILYIISLRTT